MAYHEELIELTDGRPLEVATWDVRMAHDTRLSTRASCATPCHPEQGHISIFTNHLHEVAAALQAS